MMKRKIIIALFIFSLPTLFARADDVLRVSGILQGKESLAVVNEKVLRIGDKIEGYQVVEIGADFVKFDSETGESLVKRIATSSRDIPAGGDEGTGQEVAGESQKEKDVLKAGDKLQALAEENLKNGQYYVAVADTFLEQQIVPSVGAYEKAMVLYDKAEKEFQYALERLTDNLYRKRVVAGINVLRNAREDIFKEKRHLQKDISVAIGQRVLILGMRKVDVLRSIGRPNDKNKANYGGVERDQWVYGSSLNGSYLYFDEDVLTAVQLY